MIATHNIKVNDRWIHAGERYGEESMEETYAPAMTESVPNIPKSEPVEAPAEEAKAEAKPKTASRRKKTSA